jgi:transmembrane sensor
MTTPARSDEQQRIDREASTWVVLNDERELTPEEEQAFENWRNANPRHDQSYRATLELWDDLPEAATRIPDSAVDRSNVITMIAPSVPVDVPKRRWRPLWTAAVGVVATILLVMMLAPQLAQRESQSFETALAEQRVLTLADGSLVTLGPRTRLDVAYTSKARRVALRGGEAFFEITRDASRPFLVEAGGSLIQVVGTRFDVNVSQTSLRVAVLEGTVRVRRGDVNAEQTLVLQKGQRTEVRLPDAAPGASEASRVAALEIMPTAQQPGGWRGGRLSYDNVRLADVVADMNRYHSPGVMLDDPSLGDLRVTAFFGTKEIPAFLDALPTIMAVDTQISSDGAVRISRRAF